MCTYCDADKRTYDEHVKFVEAEQLHILGTRDQMCEGMFHVFPSPEFGIKKHGCIDGNLHDRCRPQAMTLVVVCDHLTARFTNCNRIHAEEFFVRNHTFRDHIRYRRPKAVTFFMKNVPCNHSSGNARKYPDGYLFNGKPDPRSCTKTILRYYRQVMRPVGTRLVIKIGWLYKAFWKYAKREDDIVTVNNSAEGLKMLLQEGIDVEGFQMHDWFLMANLCHEPIALQHLLMHDRLVADFETQNFINVMRKRICLEQRSAASAFTEKNNDNILPKDSETTTNTQPLQKRMRVEE